jgi:hypothetical protein
VVADTRIEAELGVSPQRARLDFVEILDQIERAQLVAGLDGLVQRRCEHLVVVLALDLAGGAEAERAGRHA